MLSVTNLSHLQTHSLAFSLFFPFLVASRAFLQALSLENSFSHLFSLTVFSAHLFSRLPSEILLKILSYLDVSSLFCISHVTHLHSLASDGLNSKSWMQAVGNVAVKMEPAEDRSTGCWKWMYFRMMTGREMNKWRGALRDIGPFTGLPQQTEWVLRYKLLPLRVILKVFRGQVVVLEQSRGYYLESSMIVHWSGGRLPSYQHINSIQLYGGNVAFIMISLHFHRLVEKILLGSPNCCIMTLTLLDDFQKPFWCVSTPVTISMVKKSQSFDYSGTDFLMVYRSSEGQVKMKLVWLKEQQQFFLVALTLYVSILKVNAHFSTKYKS
uniref:F-box domain-containing protein n=1 Tax=Oreochromis niloticus TaxID=8128 RepID=I3KNL4_ORENI